MWPHSSLFETPFCSLAGSRILPWTMRPHHGFGGSAPAGRLFSFLPVLSQAPLSAQVPPPATPRPLRTSLSCSGCCAPALAASAPLAEPDSRAGSASWLQAGGAHPHVPPVPLECRVWLRQSFTGRLASETLPSLCSAARRSSGPASLWEEGICLTHIWEAGPKEAREDPGGWGLRLRRQPR